jgi:hypothetical protein
MTAPTTPRLEVRLRSAQALRDAMKFGGLNVRGLAEACGNPRHRSTIGHLHSGARDHCSPALAARIERVLRIPPHSLFDLRMTTSHVATSHKMPRRTK